MIFISHQRHALSMAGHVLTAHVGVLVNELNTSVLAVFLNALVQELMAGWAWGWGLRHNGSNSPSSNQLEMNLSQ